MKTKVNKTTNVYGTFLVEDLKKIVRKYISANPNINLSKPITTQIFFHVPGGADWSNEDLEIDDVNYVVEFKVTQTINEEDNE